MISITRLVTAAAAVFALATLCPAQEPTDGQGVASTEIEHLFFAERPQVHALVLLRRRLRGLFGRSFQLEVRSEIGEGTTVTMRIPMPKRFGVGLESPRPISSELRELALN